MQKTRNPALSVVRHSRFTQGTGPHRRGCRRMGRQPNCQKQEHLLATPSRHDSTVEGTCMHPRVRCASSRQSSASVRHGVRQGCCRPLPFPTSDLQLHCAPITDRRQTTEFRRFACIPHPTGVRWTKELPCRDPCVSGMGCTVTERNRDRTPSVEQLESVRDNSTTSINCQTQVIVNASHRTQDFEAMLYVSPPPCALSPLPQYSHQPPPPWSGNHP